MAVRTSTKDKRYRTTAPKTTAKATKTATVRQGDNLFNLAERYKTTYSAMARANPALKRVLPGQTVRVPQATVGMGDLRRFEGQQAAAPAPYTQTGSLGNFETGTTNYMGYANQPYGAAPYTGAASPGMGDLRRFEGQQAAAATARPTGMGDLRRFEGQQNRRYAMGQPPLDPRTGAYNSAYLVDPYTGVNGGAMGFGQTYSSGTGQGPFDEYGRYNLAFLRNVIPPVPPQYKQESDVWVAPEPVTGGGYGYGGGGGRGGYTPEPYQGFTGTAGRNPFGVAAANDRLFGAGIGLINWRI